MATAAVMAPTAPIESTFSSTTVPAAPNHSNIEDSENHASNLLITKMAVVLRNMGYDDDAVKKVSSRAAANTVEGSNFPADDSLGDGDSLSRFVDGELLNETKLRRRDIYLNSNEPVLLLEANKEFGLPRSQIREFKEGLLVVLRGKGIKPVRVYIRQREDLEQSHARGGVGVTVTLLNVVNTDIGGPSMVQLLDAAFHGEGWKEELVVKEAWNGYDLLWKDEAWADAAVETRQGVIEASPAEPQADDTAAAGDAPVIDQLEDQREQANTSDYRDVNAVPEDEEDVEPEAVEHPAMKELREREARRSEVQHPTWSRTQDDHGVVDIITTHSSSAKDTDPISTIAGRRNESSDDGFEVVEKT